MAPVAAAVTPSTKAAIQGFLAIAREKHTQRGAQATQWTRDQISDERYGDDHWPRRDHGYRHRIEELPLVQPVELIDHAAVKERNNRQTASKNESASLGEVQEDPEKQAVRRRPVQTREDPWRHQSQH
jgi:hypothetical protein